MRFRRETKFSEEQAASTGAGGRQKYQHQFPKLARAKPAGLSRQHMFTNDEMPLVKGFSEICNAFLKTIQGALYKLLPVKQRYVASAMRSILYFKFF